MLIKLLKYELMAECRKHIALFVAIITVAVSMLFVDNVLAKLGDFAIFDVLRSLISVAFVLLCLSSFIIILGFSISRYYKNLFKDEGYLMHTLPVKPWMHIFTKITTAYIWTILAAIVIVIGICIFTGNIQWLKDIPKVFDMFTETMKNDPYSAPVFSSSMWFTLICAVLSPLLILLYIYFCIAIGSLFNDHKILMAVVTFIAVNAITQVITTIAMGAMGYFDIIMQDETFALNNISDMLVKIYIISAIMTVVEYAALTLITNHIMKNKLNLE